LWRDEAGFVISTEMTMVASVLVIGLTAGAVTIRDQVVQELADTAMAISSFNQSMSFSAVTGCNASTAGTDFADHNDLCDETPENAVGFPAACAAVDGPADDELSAI
jgi:hypothetical protein